MGQDETKTPKIKENKRRKMNNHLKLLQKSFHLSKRNIWKLYEVSTTVVLLTDRQKADFKKKIKELV